ncbi:hypothetical protein GOBAR_AA12487 [Gossypium barbadense]|uniref:Aminotransferase-like plant mobile domain-containing protein n=1 Tax=Gossypium barbadense TaxID=3634 RepID=A0A2P5XXU4_GOSBA|nr:hypothetical protein GOBAR_AA12487 [Gossypium barbadense]
MAAFSCFSHRCGGSYHFYIPEWNHRRSYVRLPEQLEDIQLLLDQRSKAEFEWMPYADSDIIECVPLKFLAIQIWVETKNFAAPRDMKALHKLDLRGKTDENCSELLANYIYCRWRRGLGNFIKIGHDDHPTA